MRAVLVAIAVALSLVPVVASAQTRDLSNFQSACALRADGSSTVSGSFDLATGEAAQVSELGYNHRVYSGRSYSRITSFGPAWTIRANASGTHYTFIFPAVSAYLTTWKMQQGAVIHVDASSFQDTGYSPSIPITLTFYTGTCR